MHHSFVYSRSVLELCVVLFFLILAYLFLKVYFRDSRRLLGAGLFLFCIVSLTNTPFHLLQIILYLFGRQDVDLTTRFFRNIRHLNIVLVHLPITTNTHSHFAFEVLFQCEHRCVHSVLQLHVLAPSLIISNKCRANLLQKRFSAYVVLSYRSGVPREVRARGIHLVEAWFIFVVSDDKQRDSERTDTSGLCVFLHDRCDFLNKNRTGYLFLFLKN